MRRQFLMSLVLFAGLAGPAMAAGLEKAWQTDGLASPESVAWDAASGSFYVSNMGADPTAKDGDGYVSKLGADGAIAELKWISGLDAPKGIGIANGKLYTADIDHLVEIDMASGEVVANYAAEGANFLNDVVVAPDGRVFVSDTFGSAVYVTEGDHLSLWLQDPMLMGANGLTVMDGKLLVAQLGDVSQGFADIKPGTVVSVDLATKEVAYFGSPDPAGILDGIEPDGMGGVTLTDNGGGRLLGMKAGGAAIEIGALAPGAADHEFVPDGNLIVVPQTQSNAVVAYVWSR